MKRAWLAAGLVALAAGGLALAQESKEGIVGKDAPELQTREWINNNGRTAIADFKGEVVFIEQWKTG